MSEICNLILRGYEICRNSHQDLFSSGEGLYTFTGSGSLYSSEPVKVIGFGSGSNSGGGDEYANGDGSGNALAHGGNPVDNLAAGYEAGAGIGHDSVHGALEYKWGRPNV